MNLCSETIPPQTFATFSSSFFFLCLVRIEKLLFAHFRTIDSIFSIFYPQLVIFWLLIPLCLLHLLFLHVHPSCSNRSRLTLLFVEQSFAKDKKKNQAQSPHSISVYFLQPACFRSYSHFSTTCLHTFSSCPFYYFVSLFCAIKV